MILRKSVVGWLAAVVLAVRIADGGTLLPCPDCGRDVSQRALMCPNCGLRGEVIAEYAKSIPESRIGDVLDVDCDGVKSAAIPIEMDDRKFAVLPLDPVLGVSQLRLWHNGMPVAWSVPELAVDAPIVRLQIAATNLTYWVPGGELVFSGKPINPGGNKIAAVVSPIVSTNSFAFSKREWQVLQPKQMKLHGRQILKMLKGEPFELPQRTHPCFTMIENMKKEDTK